MLLLQITAVDTVATTFDATSTGSSTIDVDYSLDGSSLGASSGSNDFYVLQFLRDFDDCSSSFGGSPGISLDGETEPVISSGSTSTTTLVNSADWPTGDNKFCLRLHLMLQTDGTDFLWHQKDFKFTVTVASDNGSTNIVYETDGGVSTSLTAQTPNSAQVVDTASNGIAPTFGATVTGGPFSYGDEVTITVSFSHPLDIFDYVVDANNAIPLNAGNNNRLQDLDSNDIDLINPSYTPVGTTFPDLTGDLKFEFPVTVYQLTSLTSVRIQIPISWTNNSRRRNLLRPNNSKSSHWAANQIERGDLTTGPISGIVNEVIEVELLPYIDEDSSGGAIVGFTVGGVVSSACLATGAALFMV